MTSNASCRSIDDHPPCASHARYVCHPSHRAPPHSATIQRRALPLGCVLRGLGLATWVGKADKMQEGPLGATPHDNNKVRPSLATPSLHPLPSRPQTLTPPFRTGSLVILVSRFCDTNSSHFIQFSQMLFTEILCYVLCTPPPLQRQSDSVDRLHL